MAIANELVTAEVVDAEEFKAMAQHYRVGGVPKTLIDYRIEFVGAAPEPFFLEKVLSAQ